MPGAEESLAKFRQATQQLQPSDSFYTDIEAGKSDRPITKTGNQRLAGTKGLKHKIPV